MVIELEVLVVNLFNELHPDQEPISESPVSKTLRLSHETEYVKDRPRTRRKLFEKKNLHNNWL